MRRLPGQDRDRILAALRTLAEDPRPSGCLPVQVAGRGTYRLRVGNYCVIYTVQDDEQQVIVTRIAKRDKSTYKGLSN